MFNKKILCLFILLLCLFGVGFVSATTQTANFTLPTFQGGFSGSTSVITTQSLGPLRLNGYNLNYATGLIAIIQLATVSFGAWDSSNTKSWNTWATIQTTNAGNSQVVMSGNLAFNFVSNDTSTRSDFQITFTPSVINASALPGGSNQILWIFTQNSLSSTWVQYSEFYHSTGAFGAPTGNQLGAYFTDAGTTLPLSGTVASDYTDIYLEGFSNSIQITGPVSGAYTITLTRPPAVTGVSSLSYFTFYDASGTLSNFALGSNNVVLTSYSPPQVYAVQDPISGMYWNGTFNYPTITATVNPTNGTTLSNYNAQFLSSSGIIPSDITNFFLTSIATTSNSAAITLDSNATQPNQINFLRLNGIWKQLNSKTNAYDIVTANPYSSNFKINLAGNYGFAYYFISNVTGGNNTNFVNVTVTGTSGSSYLTIIPQDAVTGYSIQNPTIGIYSPTLGLWSNATIVGTSEVVPYISGSLIGIQVTASGYQPSTYLQTIYIGNNTVGPVLYPSQSALPSWNSTLSIQAVGTNPSGSYTVLGGASINIVSQNVSSPFTANVVTNSQGIASLTVPQLNTYKISGTATGYLPTSTSVVIATTLFNQIGLYFTPLTTTTVPTIAITTQPTIVNQNGGGYNTTPGSAGTCSTTPVIGFLPIIVNFLVCEGVSTQAGVYFIIAFAIILIGAYAGGKYGGELGVMVGVSAAYVIDLMMGFIPLWTLIAFVVIAIFTFGIKVGLG